jgi:hypothetical protein
LPDLFCYSRPTFPVWDFEVLFVPLGSYLLSIFQSAQLIVLFGSPSCRSLARDISVSCLHISVSCLHISVSCLHISVFCLHITVSCLHISVFCLLFRFQFSYFGSTPSSDNPRLFPACAWLPVLVLCFCSSSFVPPLFYSSNPSSISEGSCFPSSWS